jgi:hypothetical protein
MKTLLSALITAALTLSATAHAGNLVDVGVIDRDTGSTLPTHFQGGKLYIAGVPGHRYSVRIANRTGARVMTVLSVDGVNAITGQTADTYQSGYVLEAYQSTEIEGWRKNMSEIAQFNFTALSDSYAARTGRPSNVGVIGVAVFREKERPLPIERERDDKIAAQPLPLPRETAADAGAAAPPATAAAESSLAGRAPTAKAAAPGSDTSSNYAGVLEHRATRKEESLGTGHGARESSYASYTTFERASSQPNEVDSVWYDSYHNLVAKGVIPAPRPIAREPQPFPNQFVPDPAG